MWIEKNRYRWMPIACAHWIRAFLPSQSTVAADSSGLAVAQSTTVCTPTSAAGSDEGSVRSAWTVVAPQSRRKSAGFWRGLTMQRTS